MKIPAECKLGHNITWYHLFKNCKVWMMWFFLLSRPFTIHCILGHYLPPSTLYYTIAKNFHVLFLPLFLSLSDQEWHTFSCPQPSGIFTPYTRGSPQVGKCQSIAQFHACIDVSYAGFYDVHVPGGYGQLKVTTSPGGMRSWEEGGVKLNYLQVKKKKQTWKFLAFV